MESTSTPNSPVLQLAERVHAAQLDPVGHQRVRQAVARDARSRRRATSWMRPAAGMPATRASATVAASWRLPKWSTQVTSARRHARPSCSRPCSTTPPTKRDQGVRVDRIAQFLERSTGAQTRRPPDRRGRARRRSRHGPGGTASRCSSTAVVTGASPAELGRRHQQPVVGADEVHGPAVCGQRPRGRCRAAPCRRRGRPRRARRHSPRCGTARTQGVAARAHVERRDVVGQVDDGRPRCARGDHRVDDADELVLGPEVREEEDGA